jgi:hypothetical protein
LPGISDAETWTINTDNPEQEIAETIAGKFGGISALEFNVTYDPLLMATLVAHANTKFTVQFVIDDPALDAIIGINVPGCRLVSPGSSSSASNSSAGAMTVKLQPSGGGLIADVLQVVQTART